MSPVRRKCGKQYSRKFWKPVLKTQTGCLASVFLRITLLSLIFLSLGNVGEGIDFCFDGTKEGYRLNSTVIKYVDAHTGPECVLLCLTEEKSCRSVNFRKTSGCDKNCELLEDVASERPKLLLKNEQFDHYLLLVANRKNPEKISSKTSTEENQVALSCKELLEKNRSLTNGVYKVRNKTSFDEYQVYCHMTEIPECGPGGWTLVMKIDGNKSDFNYTSPYWTNNATYAVEDGLEGLTEKQTKLASYWNKPFSKICLGMKGNDLTKWIKIEHEASSLYDVIANGSYASTSAGKEAWKSLINNPSIQPYCNREGFNVRLVNKYKSAGGSINVRIGIVANNDDHCIDPDSCSGFGISFRGCDGIDRRSSCGEILGRCSYPVNDSETATFGFILVQ